MSAVLTHRVRKLPTPLEKNEQASLMQFLALLTYQARRVADFAYAVPNGAQLAGDGRQRAMQIASLKRQGMKPGVPDVNIDLPANGYHGLRIEMKRIGGEGPTEDQVKWHKRLREAGYCVRVCYGFDEAKRAVTQYFAGS